MKTVLLGFWRAATHPQRLERARKAAPTPEWYGSLAIKGNARLRHRAVEIRHEFREAFIKLLRIAWRW